MNNKPNSSEYAAYYERYVSLVPNGPILEILEKQNTQFCEFMAQVNEEKADFRYEKGKWSVKEVISHIIDVETTFFYRAFAISRNEQTNLPGFDHDAYVNKTDLSHISLSELIEQFFTIRKAALTLFSGFTQSMWAYEGQANTSPVSTRAVAWIMAGHVIHHMKIIHKHYL